MLKSVKSWFHHSIAQDRPRRLLEEGESGEAMDKSWKIPGFWMILDDFWIETPTTFWRRFFSRWLGLSIPPQTREITKSSGVPDDSLELIWEWMCQSEPLVNDDLGSWGSEKTSFSKKQSCHIKTRFHRRGFCIDLYSLWLADVSGEPSQMVLLRLSELFRFSYKMISFLDSKVSRHICLGELWQLQEIYYF